MKIITNNVPRFTIDAHELTALEREQFDYLDWPKIDAGEESATFFRYKGDLYSLDQFMRTEIPGWDGIATDSFFSATLIRMSADGESVTVARAFT